MQFSFKFKDNISPELARLARRLSNKKPLLEAMGEQMMSLTKRAFNDEALRPSTWKEVVKSGPKNAPLKLTGALYQSIKISGLTNNTVTVGSDRPYAAIHQLGGKTPAHTMRSKKGKEFQHPGSNIPARPYFPFDANGSPTAIAVKKLEATLKAKLQALFPK